MTNLSEDLTRTNQIESILFLLEKAKDSLVVTYLPPYPSLSPVILDGLENTYKTLNLIQELLNDLSNMS